MLAAGRGGMVIAVRKTFVLKATLVRWGDERIGAMGGVCKLMLGEGWSGGGMIRAVGALDRAAQWAVSMMQGLGS